MFQQSTLIAATAAAKGGGSTRMGWNVKRPRAMRVEIHTKNVAPSGGAECGERP